MMFFICIALVALPCVVSCFFSVCILCNYLQIVQTRMFKNVNNYILSHNVYVLLLLMFAKPWRGNAPPYLLLVVEPSCVRYSDTCASNAIFLCIFLNLCIGGFFFIVGRFYFPSVAVIGSDVPPVAIFVLLHNYKSLNC